MITVREKSDGTQVWHTKEGSYVFVPLDTLNPGDRLEADHTRPQPHVLTRQDLDDFATTSSSPSNIFVRVRNASPQDIAKPPRQN